MVFRVKRRGLLLVLVWILMLLTALSALTLLEGAFNASPDGHVIASVGWAGYLITSSFNQRQDIVAVSGSWIVPTVNVSSGDGYSSTWIGIGGQGDKTLIQVGTEQDATGDRANYHVWYEMLPDFSRQIDILTINPGDQIYAAITRVNAETHQWNVQLTDVTNGLSFNQNFVYNSTMNSGEWVMERPTLAGQVSTLADFGAVTFTDCSVTVGSQRGAISNFSYAIVQMANQQYDRLATSSMLGSDGQSFSVTFVKSG